MLTSPSIALSDDSIFLLGVDSHQRPERKAQIEDTLQKIHKKIGELRAVRGRRGLTRAGWSDPRRIFQLAQDLEYFSDDMRELLGPGQPERKIIYALDSNELRAFLNPAHLVESYLFGFEGPIEKLEQDELDQKYLTRYVRIRNLCIDFPVSCMIFPGHEAEFYDQLRYLDDYSMRFNDRTASDSLSNVCAELLRKDIDKDFSDKHIKTINRLAADPKSVPNDDKEDLVDDLLELAPQLFTEIYGEETIEYKTQLRRAIYLLSNATYTRADDYPWSSIKIPTSTADAIRHWLHRIPVSDINVIADLFRAVRPSFPTYSNEVDAQALASCHVINTLLQRSVYQNVRVHLVSSAGAIRVVGTALGAPSSFLLRGDQEPSISVRAGSHTSETLPPSAIAPIASVFARHPKLLAAAFVHSVEGDQRRRKWEAIKDSITFLSGTVREFTVAFAPVSEDLQKQISDNWRSVQKTLTGAEATNKFAQEYHRERRQVNRELLGRLQDALVGARSEINQQMDQRIDDISSEAAWRWSKHRLIAHAAQLVVSPFKIREGRFGLIGSSSMRYFLEFEPSLVREYWKTEGEKESFGEWVELIMKEAVSQKSALEVARSMLFRAWVAADLADWRLACSFALSAERHAKLAENVDLMAQDIWINAKVIKHFALRSIAFDLRSLHRTAAAHWSDAKIEIKDIRTVRGADEFMMARLGVAESALLFEEFFLPELVGREEPDFESIPTAVALLRVVLDRRGDLINGNFAERFLLYRAVQVLAVAQMAILTRFGKMETADAQRRQAAFEALWQLLGVENGIPQSLQLYQSSWSALHEVAKVEQVRFAADRHSASEALQLLAPWTFKVGASAEEWEHVRAKLQTIFEGWRSEGFAARVLEHVVDWVSRRLSATPKSTPA